MAKYELSQQQIENVIIFLQRVDLKGKEAVSLVSIFQSLANPLQEEKLTPVDKSAILPKKLSNDEFEPRKKRKHK